MTPRQYSEYQRQADIIEQHAKRNKMNNEYIIINKTAIQQRIEELEKMKIKTSNEDEKGFNQKVWNDLIHDSELMSEYKTLKKILSQSTPLIPEIEKAYTKAFSEGTCFGATTIYKYETSKEYISNLKLDM